MRSAARVIHDAGDAATFGKLLISRERRPKGPGLQAVGLDDGPRYALQNLYSPPSSHFGCSATNPTV
jgi:hypothetical protein